MISCLNEKRMSRTQSGHPDRSRFLWPHNRQRFQVYLERQMRKKPGSHQSGNVFELLVGHVLKVFAFVGRGEDVIDCGLHNVRVHEASLNLQKKWSKNWGAIPNYFFLSIENCPFPICLLQISRKCGAVHLLCECDLQHHFYWLCAHGPLNARRPHRFRKQHWNRPSHLQQTISA